MLIAPCFLDFSRGVEHKRKKKKERKKKKRKRFASFFSFFFFFLIGSYSAYEIHTEICFRLSLVERLKSDIKKQVFMLFS
jgi:hypothetical protein